MSPTRGRDAGVLIAGIAYASPDEVLELEEYTKSILRPTGLPLVVSLGQQDGAYASLNHAKLQGFGFYNSTTRQRQQVGSF